MKNYSNHSPNQVWSALPGLVTFEIVTVLSSITIVATSGLVLRHIYSKVTRSRTDLLFVVLSISDIGVGVLSQTVLGLWALCNSSPVDCSDSAVLGIAGFFLMFFPYMFSHTVTTIMAIDRLLVVTKHQFYENFVTRRILKGAVTFSLALSVGFCTWFTYTKYYTVGSYVLSYIMNLTINVVSPVIILVAYIYLLFFVWRQSNAMSHCKSTGNKDFKRLTKTIMFIFISQSICVVPYQSMLLVGYMRPSLEKQWHYWSFLLRNNSCFINGFILLISERRKVKKKINLKTDAAVRKNVQRSALITRTSL